MRLALDTNVLVYAEGYGDGERCATARELVARAPADRTILPVQVLGELHRVLTRKARRSADDAKLAVAQWTRLFDLAATDALVLHAALELSVDHRLQFWDAVIVSAAARAGCALLISEDMHDGFTWSGVTVVDPFAPSPSPLLVEALSA